MTIAFTTSDRGLRKLATSLRRAILAQAREGSRHRKMRAWRSVSLPGTELSFADKVTCIPTGLLAWR